MCQKAEIPFSENVAVLFLHLRDCFGVVVFYSSCTEIMLRVKE